MSSWALLDNTANFITQKVSTADKVRFTYGNGSTAEFVIVEVTAEEQLIFEKINSTDADPQIAAGVSYTVVTELDRQAQAEAISAVSASFGSSRCVHVWPDQYILEDQVLPGYYIAAIIAGMVGGLPSQRGLTRIGVPSIDKLTHSSGYFTDAQLDVIADGGTFILTQEASAASPVVRHQLTTDRSTVEFQELSFVKNFDYVSDICQDVLDNYLGQYNITNETLGLLDTAIRSTLESLKLARLPKLGAPVLGYSIGSIAQSDVSRDRVEMYAEVDFPYPLNTIGLHLISR